MPDAALPPLAALELELELEPHASSTIAAIPAAPPVSAVRRVTWRQRLNGVSSALRSSHSSRSMASPKNSVSDISLLSVGGSGRRLPSQTETAQSSPINRK